MWPFKRKFRVVDASHMVALLPPIRKPKAGEKWVLMKGGDPWNREKYPATILDTKDEWVRYHLCDIWPDNRMKMEIFVHVYEPKDKQ